MELAVPERTVVAEEVILHRYRVFGKVVPSNCNREILRQVILCLTTTCGVLWFDFGYFFFRLLSNTLNTATVCV